MAGTRVRIQINDAKIMAQHGQNYPVGIFMDRVRGSLEANTRMLAPRRTGNLRSTIESRHVRINQHASKVTVTVGAKYATFVHNGTSTPDPAQGVVRRQGRHGLHDPVRRAGRLDVHPGRSRRGEARAGFYLAWMLAVQGQEANPFLADAAKATRATYARYISR